MGNGKQEYKPAVQQGGRLPAPKPKKRETNVQFIKRVMEFAQSGALMQVFIMDALIKHSDFIANMPYEEFEKEFGKGSLFHPMAWHQCAKELQRELNERPS